MRFRLIPARSLILASVLLFAMLLAPYAAFADIGNVADPKPPFQFVLPTAQLWALIAGAIITLPTYLINKYAPWVSDAAKGVVHWVTAAIAGGITQAITAGGVGLNQTTLQFVVTAIVAAIAIQPWWKKTGIGLLFGQGQNRPGQTPGSLQIGATPGPRTVT